MKKMAKELKAIIEEPDLDKANELAASNDFCQPRWSEYKKAYIFIRRKE